MSQQSEKFSEMDSSLDALKNVSDEELWAVVHERLSEAQDVRLRELAALGDAGQSTMDTLEEMEALVEVVDQQMLLRSGALLLLKQRGHDISRYINTKH